MINGDILRRAIISGANNISNNKKMVDELNVFPVPDGDTGTNMSMTIQNAAKELKVADSKSTVAEISQIAASALLRGARGNSGVILSLLFRGFARGLKEKKTADATDIVKALEIGVAEAYKAVMKPTEGTILTVARVASEKSAESDITDPKEMWEFILNRCEETLLTTPELLPVLKKAGVVDAGGKGLCIIFEGMNSVISGGEIIEIKDAPKASTESVTIMPSSAIGEFEGDIEFAYCTEFIVNRENDDDPLKLRAFLESIGDSVVVVDDDDIIKVHVHTNNPGNALQEGLKFGSLTSMKIENMREQHTTKVVEHENLKMSSSYVPVDDDIKYGFVAVAAGDGLKSLFTDLGCGCVVNGGQTMNPSTDDILRAVQTVPASTVFVLPNNKNIIMAAEQAVSLADRNVVVLPTVTVPQGISAMLAFDPEKDDLENQMAMTNAFAKVSTGQITFAARDSDFDGHKIKKGEILALGNNKLMFSDSDLEKSVVKLTKSFVNKSTEFITLIYGEDVSAEQADKMVELVKSKVGNNIEVMLIDGGQPVYYYIISVE